MGVEAGFGQGIERLGLQNLIDNALRFAPAGGAVTLAIDEKPAGQGGQYAISVSDSGRGIAAEHLPHVFDRYWRAGPDDELRAGTSSGLGLAIVKRILELHGSAVRVQSRPAEGTRFEFALPQAGRDRQNAAVSDACSVLGASGYR